MIPMVITMGIIFFLSHQQGDTLELPSLPFLDKFLHSGIYFILGLSASFSVPTAIWKTKPGATASGVLIFCLVYGISDELHQAFVPGRFPSLADIAADTIGAGCAALFYFSLMRSRISSQLFRQ